MPNSFEVGDVVTVPSWFRLTKRQSRINIIAHIDHRGNYAVLVKRLKNGQMSEDRQAVIYLHISKLPNLRHLDSIHPLRS